MRGVVASLIVVAGVFGACSTVSEEKPSCLIVGCGAHGKCELVGDSESCVCDLGYAGISCGECASGFQDVDGNGLCSSSCGDCGPHARCSEVSGRAVCSCFVGYSPHEAGGCIFTGGPVDPGFDNPQPNGWRTSGAVRISTGRPSDVLEGTGWARFSGFGEVSQSFEMPHYADAEPLALEVDLACTTGGFCARVQRPASIVFDGVTLDNTFYTDQLLPRGSIETMRFCLGERAFGRTLELGLRRYSADSGGFGKEQDALVGRMQIVPSADCAAPGTVKNGDFEAGAWKYPRAVEVVQENATHVARFTAACGGSGASAVTSLSIPEAMSRPALLFSINGQRGGSADVFLDFTPIAQLPATGTKERAVVCLPSWMRGFASWLLVRVEPPSDCAEGPNVVDVDDFVVASDPSCDDDDVIGNSGFERPGLSPWTGRHATVVSADAHAGNAYLTPEPDGDGACSGGLDLDDVSVGTDPQCPVD